MIFHSEVSLPEGNYHDRNMLKGDPTECDGHEEETACGVSPKLLVFEGKTWKDHIYHGGLICCSAGEATYITWAFWSWTPLGQVAKYLGNPQTFEDEMRVSPSTAAFDLSMGWSSSSSKRISKLRARRPAFNREEMMKGQIGLVLYRVKCYDTGNSGWQ